jgi:hypothetical protein
MIAVLVGNAPCVSARCLSLSRERSSALSRLGGGCGVELVRGQGPPVFGKCARLDTAFRWVARLVTPPTSFLSTCAAQHPRRRTSPPV